MTSIHHRCLSHECKKCPPLQTSGRLYEAVGTAFPKDMQAQESLWGTDIPGGGGECGNSTWKPKAIHFCYRNVCVSPKFLC